MSFESNDPHVIYTNWVLICEQIGYTLSWEVVRRILLATKAFFEKQDKVGISKHINEIILKKADVDAGDLDNIRFLLHREIDSTQLEPTEFLEKIKKKYGSL